MKRSMRQSPTERRCWPNLSLANLAFLCLIVFLIMSLCMFVQAPHTRTQTSPLHHVHTVSVIEELAQQNDQPVELSREERDYLNALGPITVCPDPDWRPFEWFEEDGTFRGIAADLLRLIEKRLNVTFDIVKPDDWNDALTRSQNGEVLILPFLNKTTERSQWLTFTQPLLNDANVFITREDHPFITDARQLANETVVLPKGTSIEEWVRRDYPNLDVLLVESERDVFRAVDRREADLALRSLIIAAYTIRKEGYFNLRIAGQAPPQYNNQLRMGVLKTNPMLRDILDKAIATITPYEREHIINRHINITVIQPFNYQLISQGAIILIVLIMLSFYWNMRLQNSNKALVESEHSQSILLSNLQGTVYRRRADAHWSLSFISDECERLTGYASQALTGTMDFRDCIHPDDRSNVEAAWASCVQNQTPLNLEYRILTLDGSTRWVLEKGNAVVNENKSPSYIEGLIIDITDRKAMEETLYRISIHDPLTELHNRRYVVERLENLLHEKRRDNRTFAMAILDLDHFKRVNDRYGHGGGDHVLRHFSKVLASSMRPYDLVGRLGGEEFLVIAVNTDASGLTGILQRVQSRLKEQKIVYQTSEIRLTFSAGLVDVALVDTLNFDVEALLGLADKRLYKAKREGRDRIISTGEEETNGQET